MRVRHPSWMEIAFQVLAVLLLVVFILDFVQAATAVACGQQGLEPGSNCYPWGAEGPAAGYWQYRSKATYLISCILQIAVLLFAFAVPFLVKRAIISLGLMLLLILPSLLILV
ncbi:MAG: hypothetical protein KF765_03180 [Parvibaculaceae bacterium]|nr:hypothetical protein [Parvibaculaceae bacterium]